MIKYLGSKRLLVPAIVDLVRRLKGVRRVADLFSGTARVGHALKRAGLFVRANDQLAYAHRLAACYVQADAERLRRDAERLLGELARLPPDDGWFTETYCRQARYFTPENGARIEAIRAAIAARSLPFELESVLLVALMEAADRVDSTVGVQMAYLKQWAPRALDRLELRLPDVLPGAGETHCLEARQAAAHLDADLVYLDPPYNQHSYLGNYHVWETLVRWDEPATYGVARKRTDVKRRKSDFNSRERIGEALAQVLANLRAPHVLVSFNDEGYLSPGAMIEMLSRRGEVRVRAADHPRYVGAKIGIYNPDGVKVGTPGRLRNRELLFFVSRDTAALRSLPPDYVAVDARGVAAPASP
jgi:adenine-specific DNA-methyltransferase